MLKLYLNCIIIKENNQAFSENFSYKADFCEKLHKGT